MSVPILYSFRRCPYAMRARLALGRARINVEHREILLKNKPPQMLEVSEKGTVPVLVLPDGKVIDESLDIALWALKECEKQQPSEHDLLWNSGNNDEQLKLIRQNDDEFKYWLDRYKYSVGYPEEPPEYYRSQAEQFLHILEEYLSATASYLFGDQPSLADIAIFPFVRQFAFVDKDWFDQTDYPYLHVWLSKWLQSEEFESVMIKYPEWSSIQSI